MNDQYEALYQTFRWLVPTQFNIADACCHRWAASSPDARRIAIYYEDEAGNREVWTYARLAEAANQLANGLVKMGVERGDRVGVVLGQRPETVVAHMAIYSVGAVVLPLSPLFGPEALESRLRDADARVAIVDYASSANLLAISDNCPNLHQIIGRRAGAALAQPAGAPAERIQDGGHARVRPGHPDVHVRHHRRPQGRAAAAQRADRQPARLRRVPGLVSPARRRLLVAGGLGLDGGHDGRPAADPVFRPPHRRHARALYAGTRLRADGALPIPSCSRPR